MRDRKPDLLRHGRERGLFFNAAQEVDLRRGSGRPRRARRARSAPGLGRNSASPAKAARDIALLHRRGLEYQKPAVIPRKLNEDNEDKEEAFVASYEKHMNSLDGAQRVHERAQVRPEGRSRLQPLRERSVQHGRTPPSKLQPLWMLGPLSYYFLIDLSARQFDCERRERRACSWP